ncbi:MAG: hypothetical protein HKP14_06645 [Bacteroidia bacterium]|nr:hypothetical protein [Bacteroidia bacterium]
MYKKLNWLSIFFIFMLFAIGGLVRSTGSGMGCPDWPKCFGEYIPPASESELPDNYEEYFKTQRIQKTERFVKLLQTIGMDDLAQNIEQNLNLEEEHTFNVTKAYVEYGNRLWGALTGLIVFVTLLASIPFLNSDKRIFFLTLFGFLMVFINAFLGAIVVNSNLLSGLVTIHFLAAFAAISFFILARIRVKSIKLESSVTTNLLWISVSLLLLAIVQIVLGTQVRGIYDSLESQSSQIISVIDTFRNYQWHRVLAFAMLLLASFQYVRIKQEGNEKSITKLALYLPLLTLLQILLGVLLIYANWVAFSKLFHITIGATIFVIQFYICTLIIRAPKKV